ncbi:MAG TPA: hypothetical protein PLO78_00805 [Candidatus Omnitrophota bacterium]|nr:hypothetical protein [Candidatus Omnitrophota bacterium]
MAINQETVVIREMIHIDRKMRCEVPDILFFQINKTGLLATSIAPLASKRFHDARYPRKKEKKPLVK